MATTADDDGSAAGGGSGEIPSEEELIRSGPMTVQKAELLGEDVDFGPRCDTERGTVMMPSTYAPPCIEPFEGDNGGATSPGVTADEIKLVYYNADPAIDPLAAATATQAGVDVDPEAEVATIQGYLDVYNEVFETYGRTVTLEVYTGTGANDDVEAALADAIAIAEKEPFAVIGGPAQASAVFAGELASRGIVCGPRCAFRRCPRRSSRSSSPTCGRRSRPRTRGCWRPRSPSGTSPGRAPPSWPAIPPCTTRTGCTGSCTTTTSTATTNPCTRTSSTTSASTASSSPPTCPYTLDLARVQENARTMIASSKEAGVTTVIYYGDPISPSALTTEATAQDYWPEWILGPNLLMDTTVFARLTDGEQWKNGFGVSTSPARGALEATESYEIYDWAYGEAPPHNAFRIFDPLVRTMFNGHPHGGARPDARDVPRRRCGGRRRRAGGPTAPLVSRGDHGSGPRSTGAAATTGP